MSEATVSDVLVEARGLIERGWGKPGLTVAEEPFVCVVTAMASVTLVPRPTTAQFAKALSLLGFATPRHAHDWNDHPSRTQEQVLARYDRAIERVRAAASPSVA